MKLLKLVGLCLGLSISACEKPYKPNPNSKAIGHGGMGISHTIPIDTYESIYQCISTPKADGVEFDIQLSADSIWVVFHDKDLNPATNAFGNIFNLAWATMDGTYYRNPMYARYRLVNAHQVLSNIPNKEQFIFSIDLKFYNLNANNGYLELLAQKCVELIHQHQLTSNSYISNNSLYLLEQINNLDSTLNLFIYNGSDFNASVQQALDKHLDGVTMHIEFLNKKLVDEAHSLGLKVATFGLNSTQKNIDAIEYGVDYLETDKLLDLINLLH